MFDHTPGPRHEHQRYAVSRRGVLAASASAWAVPAITVTGAAPAFASSEACPTASGQIRWSAGLSFAGLSSGVMSGRWVTGISSGRFTFRIGYIDSGTGTLLAGVQFTSGTQGLVAQVSADEYHVTVPHVVIWDAPPAGWTITPSTTTPQGKRYIFRRNDSATVKTTALATPDGAAVASGATGSAVPASPTFGATLVSSQFVTGQHVLGPVNVPVGATLTRQILNPTRPECTTPAERRTPTETMTIEPRTGATTLARRSGPEENLDASDDAEAVTLV